MPGISTVDAAGSPLDLGRGRDGDAASLCAQRRAAAPLWGERAIALLNDAVATLPDGEVDRVAPLSRSRDELLPVRLKVGGLGLQPGSRAEAANDLNLCWLVGGASGIIEEVAVVAVVARQRREWRRMGQRR